MFQNYCRHSDLATYYAFVFGSIGNHRTFTQTASGVHLQYLVWEPGSVEVCDYPNTIAMAVERRSTRFIACQQRLYHWWEMVGNLWNSKVEWLNERLQYDVTELYYRHLFADFALLERLSLTLVVYFKLLSGTLFYWTQKAASGVYTSSRLLCNTKQNSNWYNYFTCKYPLILPSNATTRLDAKPRSLDPETLLKLAQGLSQDPDTWVVYKLVALTPIELSLKVDDDDDDVMDQLHLEQFRKHFLHTRVYVKCGKLQSFPSDSLLLKYTCVRRGNSFEIRLYWYHEAGLINTIPFNVWRLSFQVQWPGTQVDLRGFYQLRQVTKFEL